MARSRLTLPSFAPLGYALATRCSGSPPTPLPPFPSRRSRALRGAAALVALAVAGACGADRTGGPRGRSDAIVGRATQVTLAAGSARFDVAGPRWGQTGEVDLSGGIESPDGPWPAAMPVFARPLVAVALVRGAVEVVPYGGQAVRGVSTFRYEVDLSPERAARLAGPAQRPALEALDRLLVGPTLFADLWVDARGRLVRVQVPLDPNEHRPMGDSKATVAVVTVDLFDYQKG